MMTTRQSGRNGALYVVSGALVAAVGVIAFFVLARYFPEAQGYNDVEVKIELPAAPGKKAP